MAKNKAETHLSLDTVESYRKKFNQEPRYKLAMNAVTRNALREIALNRDVLNSTNWNFTYEIETAEATDQARASTCWLFANLNWLRTLTQKKINVKQFEFSENFMLFYDKLEKSNYFLENMIDLRDRDWTDREFYHLMNDPVQEGGEWHMTVNLVEKYGIVPKEIMPDTFNRTESRYINEILMYKLREGALHLRDMHRRGKSVSELRQEKKRIMEIAYRILAIGFGVPPQKFSWSYRDEDKKYHQEIDITPIQFYQKYVGLKCADMYCLLSAPLADLPMGKAYTIKYFNNMPDGHKIHYLNVPIDLIKQTALKVLKKGEACMFGCEVRYMSHSKEGILADDLYDYGLLFDTTFGMNKAERVESLHVRCTHAMVLTGVELVNKKPVTWRIENSWGDKVGKKGTFIMSDEWFDEYVFDLIVHKKYLTETILRQFKQKPVELPPWHPLG
ncbi:C1 family peptidase [bacterium]|nr:C1 family peptidase [bacterium]